MKIILVAILFFILILMFKPTIDIVENYTVIIWYGKYNNRKKIIIRL